MKELAVQSANDTNTQFDRGEIQREVDQLKTEIDRISRDTEFNTMKLLNGTMENRATVTTMVTDLAGNPNDKGTYNDSSFKFEISGSVVQAGVYSLTASTEAMTGLKGTAIEVQTVGVHSDFSATTNIVFKTFTSLTGGGTGLGAKFGEYRLDISSNLGGTYDLTLTGPDGKYQRLEARDSKADAVFDQLGVEINFAGASITGDGYITFTNALTEGKFTLQSSANGTKVELEIGKGKTIQTYTGQTLNMGGVQYELSVGLFTSTNSHATAIIDVVDKSIKLHIGANEGQNMGLSILDSSAKALGINKVDLTQQKTADVAITAIDNAINRVSSERSKMGAIINRLDHTIKNLGTTSENMQSSESRIRDVDMAKEIMEFTKSNILSQASQAMLAQANMMPQGVLSLLQ
jgi:flagellin